MAPFLNDDFKSMMEDTAKFREEIQKVRFFVLCFVDIDRGLWVVICYVVDDGGLGRGLWVWCLCCVTRFVL